MGFTECLVFSEGKEKDQKLWRSQPHQFSNKGGARGASTEEYQGRRGLYAGRLSSSYRRGRWRLEPWRFFRDALLKDYSCKASAFGSCTDGSGSVPSQTVGDRGGLKDLSAWEAPEHVWERRALS